MFVSFPDRAPPQQGVTNCADLKLWVKTARRNELRWYAKGAILAQVCRPTLREYVMALADLGYLTCHVMWSREGERLHVVQRTAKIPVEGQL